VKLDGFLIDVLCTTESTLEVEIDCSHISWDEYKQLIIDLEDLLSEIDQKHSARSWLVKGRSLRGRYRRITAEDRRRRLRFSPFPSCFQNILKNTRAFIYNLVAENCLVLETIGKRKMYFLPKSVAPAFLEAVEKINDEVIEPLKKNIEKFRNGNDYFRIKQTLWSYKINPSVLDTAPFAIGRYHVEVVPVDFSYSIDADEVYRKMEKTAAVKGLEILRKEIEREQKEYYKSIISTVIQRITKLAEVAESKRTGKVAARINRLIEICNSLGLYSVKEKVLEPLKTVIETKDSRQKAKLIKELFGKESLKEGITEILKNLNL